MDSPETNQPKRKRRHVSDVKAGLSSEANGAPILKRRKQVAQPGQGGGGNEEIGLRTGSRKVDRNEQRDQESKTIQKTAAAGVEVGDGASFDGLGGSLSVPKVVHALRNPKLSMDRKLELACNFIGAFERRQDEKDEWIEMPHFVSFFSDWLQSAIIKSTKEAAVTRKQLGGTVDKECVPASLNAKCWTALHWCLRSEHLSSVSPGILKGITFVLAEFAIKEQDLGRTGECEAGPGTFGRGLSEALADVLHVLLAEYERSFRPNFDQWFSLALAALNLAQVKGLTSLVSLNDDVGPLHLLVLVVIEGFTRFVTWYPYPRTVFEAVVEKLLPPLLLALADSSWQVSGDLQHQNDHSNIWHARYLKALQSLVRDGLFNSTHVGEFAEACVFIASPSSSGVEHSRIKEAKISGGQGSTYHRRLFEKLEQLRRNGNPVALSTMGLMLRAYAQKLKSHSAAAVQDVFGIQVKDKVSGSQNQTGGENTTPVNIDEVVPEGQSTNTKDTAAGQMSLQKKALRQSEKLFAVFAEFTGPLVKEFGELFQNLTSDNFELVDATISRAVYLLNAVNSLLYAAKDENVYIPTEDTLTDAHLGFFKCLQESVVKAAGLLAAIPVDNKFGHGILPSAAPLMKQIVVSCGHLLYLECRVTEEHVTGIWLILFMATAVGHTEENDDGNSMECVTSPEVLEVACQIIQTYSDLRQVDRAILVLCSCLRNIMTKELVVAEVEITDNWNESLCLLLSKAVQSVVASRPFLDTVASVMKKLPEGQTAQVLRGVAADLVKTLELFGKVGGKVHDADGATNALSEIYAHVLDNANVTATNSVLVGASFRKAGNSGISIPLANLIDIALSNFRRGVCESDGESRKQATGLQQKGCKNKPVTRVTGQQKRSTGDGLEVREKCSQLSASRTCFLLRIFLAYRSLDRQCRSLMPPKVARKANAEIGEPSLDLLSMSSKEISISLAERKLFSCIGLCTEHLPDILRGIEEVHDQVSDKYSALAYLLDCLALQRVIDVKNYLRMLKFHPVKFDQEEDTAPDKGDSNALFKIVASLKQETSSLVAFMCRGVIALRQSMEHVSAESDVDKQALNLENLGDVQERGWDMIISTLRAETLPVARWRLLCLTVDVWSEHAADSSLEDFVACMLASHCNGDRRPGVHTKSMLASSFRGATSHQSTCVKDLTEALFTDSRFFEQHQLRKVFSSVFWKNIKDYVPAVFHAQCFSGKGDDAELESTTEIRLISRRVTRDFEKQATFISQRLALLKEAPISQSKALRRIWKLVAGTKFHRTFRALESCSSFLELLSQLPRGYFSDSDAAEHALHLVEVERYLVFAIFNIRDAVLLKRKEFVVLECGTNLRNMVTVLLQAFSSCRCALKSLSFPGPNEAEKGCAVTRKLLESQESASWLTLSVHAAAAAVSDLGIFWQGSDANVAPFMWNHFYAMVVSTCQIIRYICGNVFNQEARSLLIIDKASGSPDNIHHSPGLVDADLSFEQSMPRLAHALYEQIRVFEPCFTSVNPSLLNKEGNSQRADEQVESSSISSQRDWFGVYVVLSAVGSYLWSIVSSLEGINEKCHDGDNHDLRWQAELPKSWLLSMKELETVLVKSLLSLVAPGETEVVAVDNQQSAERKTGKQKKVSMLEDNAKVRYDDDPLNNDRMSNEEIGRPDNLMEGSSDLSTQGLDLTAIAESERRTLHHILGGNEVHRSECVGQLFSGAAALLRVRSLCFAPSATGFAAKSFLQFGQADRSLAPWVKVLLRVAYWLLEEAVTSSSLFEASNKRWLLGVVQFMESIGGLLSCVSPPIPVSSFGKLIDLHMKLLGALAPSRQELVELNTVGSAAGESLCGNVYDMVHRVKGDFGYGRDFLASLKHATEMSFGMLLKDCPRQHFLVALQLAEKSVVDAPVFGYGLEFSLDNERSGRPVAAGIQTMAIFLKAITSKNRLRLLANHSAVFLSAIFNLLGKIQNLQLDMLPCEHTWQDEASLDAKAASDAAVVILQCLEILTMLASRPVLFPMGANYVSMGLHLPALLFRPFYEVRMPAHVLSQSYLSADQQTEVLSARGGDHSELLIKLYVACCQHLCSLLRHRTREAGHCIALLGESVKVLLRCLGVPNWHSSWKRPGGKAWNIADVKVCASWLRRVYEELGEQKATLGNYSAHILAEYLCVVSGVGALSSGLNREVESALRPGAFALVDACTPRDLQQLYATLGDGPQRTALTSLRNDYERHFKYTGKV